MAASIGFSWSEKSERTMIGARARTEWTDFDDVNRSGWSTAAR
jgi:hypothetical protein